MKKIIGLSMILMAFMLTGCSIQIDSETGLSAKSEELVSKAEAIETEFNSTLNTIAQLEGKQSLSSDDQELIDNQIDRIMMVVDDFKETDTPFLGKKVKELADQNLKERERTLLNVQEKAENRTMTKEDLQKVKKAISDDVTISLFN
ncbi:hypothetical protein ACFOU2_19465 [Bacillus songklensis]|uniref:Lipoprotein n=1 Tax=Bacillus songklensis TaxID=1069116 RepID=A0ABV8B8K6_9BACI